MNYFINKVIELFLGHWRLILGAVAAFLVFLMIVSAFRSCNRQKVKIDESQIQKINSENEKERKAELQKIIAENSDVIKTVDERTELSEVNRVEKEREIDARINEVNQKIEAAKVQGRDVTQKELVCLLQPTECK